MVYCFVCLNFFMVFFKYFTALNGWLKSTKTRQQIWDQKEWRKEEHELQMSHEVIRYMNYWGSTILRNKAVCKYVHHNCYDIGILKWAGSTDTLYKKLFIHVLVMAHSLLGGHANAVCIRVWRVLSVFQR